MTKEEMESLKTAKENELRQSDYARLKMAAEAVRVIRRLFPEENMPVFEKYQAVEERADALRREIDELECDIAEGNYDSNAE